MTKKLSVILDKEKVSLSSNQRKDFTVRVMMLEEVQGDNGTNYRPLAIQGHHFASDQNIEILMREGLDSTTNVSLDIIDKNGNEIWYYDNVPLGDDKTNIELPAKTFLQSKSNFSIRRSVLFLRSGSFQEIGFPNRDFKSKLYFDICDTEMKKHAVRRFFGVQEEEEIGNQVRKFDSDPNLLAELSNFDLKNAEITPKGKFTLSRKLDETYLDTDKAQGWFWVLHDEDSYFGFVSEHELITNRGEITLYLPYSENKTPISFEDLDNENGFVRIIDRKDPDLIDVDEQTLLENPDIFSDDPGSSCTPFSSPHRIVSERSFQTILRVTEPQINPEGYRYTYLRTNESESTGPTRPAVDPQPVDETRTDYSIPQALDGFLIENNRPAQVNRFINAIETMHSDSFWPSQSQSDSSNSTIDIDAVNALYVNANTPVYRQVESPYITYTTNRIDKK
ncbi:MAG: hypothetical protein HRU19_13725 [Pseudobacteriovorax sp.]|nr:hypothetical protein [Pseudobacteriovorax sp.]